MLGGREHGAVWSALTWDMFMTSVPGVGDAAMGPCLTAGIPVPGVCERAWAQGLGFCVWRPTHLTPREGRGHMAPRALGLVPGPACGAVMGG